MPRSSDQICNETFLESRAKLLEVAANLDRIDRAVADGSMLSSESQTQRQTITEAIEILLSSQPDRAARLQHLFSRKYDSDWRQKMQI